MTIITRVSIAAAAALLLLIATPSARAEHWRQWRGPHFDGSSNETNLPDSLDPKSAAWATPLPGSGSGTPVVFGDRIYLSALDKNTRKLLALSLNRADGKILWTKEIAEGAMRNERNDLASPSPITDGKTTWFYYGTGDLVAFDRDGNQLWARNIEKDHGRFNMLWIYSASPLLYNGKLYIPVLHRDVPPQRRGAAPSASAPADSYLLCVDLTSGKDVWRVVRPTDAVQEAREAYTTPIPVEVNGKTQIVLMGGDYVTGHDPDDGHELWRFGSYNPGKVGHWRTVASACAGGGLIFCSPPKNGNRGETFYAVKPPGESGNAILAWKSGDFTTDVCVPLYYKDQLFVLDGDRKKLLSLDPKTGDKHWTADLGGKPVYRASPTGADGKIYCMNEAGDVAVVSVADGKILDRQSLGSETAPSRSSIVAAEGQVFVRTADRLYAFAKK
jgi:outer membrane protein assembly factor BamB